MARKPIEERLFIKNPDNGILYVHGFAHGKSWNASTGFTEAERDKAIARACELERARLMAPEGHAVIEARKRSEEAQRLTLEEACAQLYDHDVRENAKKKTFDFHAERCASLMRGLGKDSRLVDITDPPTLLTYFTRRLEGATLKQRHTVQKDYRVLRQILKICKQMRLWEGDLDALLFDCFKISSKYYAPGETWLDEVEYIDALIAEVSSGRSLVRRTKRNAEGRAWVNRAPVRVDRKYHVISYVNLGLRDDELFTVYPHHVSLKNKIVAINYPKDAAPDDFELRKGKTIEAKRVLGLNAVMVEVMRRRLKDAEPDKPLFEPWQNALRDLKAAWRRARKTLIQKRLDDGDMRGAKMLDMTLPRSLCLNDLRRTFCSQMAKAGVPLQTCADLMGHTDDTMVKRVYRRCVPAQHQSAMEMMPSICLPVVPLKAPERAISEAPAPAITTPTKASQRNS